MLPAVTTGCVPSNGRRQRRLRTSGELSGCVLLITSEQPLRNLMTEGTARMQASCRQGALTGAITSLSHDLSAQNMQLTTIDQCEKALYRSHAEALDTASATRSSAKLQVLSRAVAMVVR